MQKGWIKGMEASNSFFNESTFGEFHRNVNLRVIFKTLKYAQVTWLHNYTTVFRYWKSTKIVCGALKLSIMVA